MKKSHTTNDPDALATSLLEVSARTHLKEFLSLAHKDLMGKIDFTKGYDIMDDEMPYYIPKAQLEQKNTFTLFIKTTLKGLFVSLWDFLILFAFLALFIINFH